MLDLDGTLIDSVPQVHWAMNEVLSMEGMDLLSLGDVKASVGDGVRVMFEKAISNQGFIREDELDRLIQKYLATYLDDPIAKTVVYEGVEETLEELCRAGAKMGICTNKPSQTTRSVLSGTRLIKFFDAVVTADDTKCPKPSGQHVLDTLDAMESPKRAAVMVGDSENDIEAGRAAGVRTVAVTYGYCQIPVADLRADALIDRFNALPKTLWAMKGGNGPK